MEGNKVMTGDSSIPPLGKTLVHPGERMRIAAGGYSGHCDDVPSTAMCSLH